MIQEIILSHESPDLLPVYFISKPVQMFCRLLITITDEPLERRYSISSTMMLLSTMVVSLPSFIKVKDE